MPIDPPEVLEDAVRARTRPAELDRATAILLGRLRQPPIPPPGPPQSRVLGVAVEPEASLAIGASPGPSSAALGVAAEAAVARGVTRSSTAVSQELGLVDESDAAAAVASSSTQPPAPTISLRTAGVWSTILTPAGASSNTTTQAALLVSELGRIFGSSPPSAVYSNQAGVRVGLASEWGVSIGGTWDWAIASVSGQPYVLGRDARGLAVAIRRALHGLGWRRLTTVWEIFPPLAANLATPQETRALPFRFFNHGISLLTAGAQTTRVNDWIAANALVNDGLWGYGHAYSAIKAAKAADFAANPHWLAGDGSGTKFCVFELGLQADCVSFARAQFTLTNGRKCTSVATSDGSTGWDQACAGTGEQLAYAPSDRQAKLGNVVQAALSSDDPDHHCAIQAYADCSAPPTQIPVDPRMLVIWATAFMQHGLSAEQVRDGYLARGAVLHAPYSYPSEWLWDYDMPCQARASRRDELAVEADRLRGGTTPAGGWAAENSPAFAPFGRWFWSIAGLQFGEDPVARWDAWPAIAFPSAPALALEWFNAIDTPVPQSSDLVHRMGQAAKDLIQALVLGSDERERALDLARWVVYVSLFRAYQANPGRTTFEPVLQWCYRIRNRDVTTFSAFYDLDTYATDRKSVAVAHGVPGGDLTSSNVGTIFADTPTTDAEILSQLTTIIAANPLLPFTPVGFSDTDLVRVAGLTHADTVPGAFVAQVHDYEWWYHAGGADIFTFKAGVVRQDLGPVRVTIYEFNSGDVVWDESLPVDKVTRTTANPAQLPPVLTKAQHLYKISVTNARGGLTWSWGHVTGVTYPGTDQLQVFTAGYSFFFYVPRGTQQVGFFAQSGNLKFFSADNVQVGSTITAANNFYAVTVPEGKDGQCWKIEGVSNKFRLYTVPRQMAQEPTELLLPREVAEADGLALADATPPSVPQFPVLTFSRNLVRPSTPLTGTGAGYFNYEGFDGSAYTVGTGSAIAYTLQAGVVSNGKGDSVVTVVDTTTNLTVAIWSSAPDQVVRTFSFTGIAGRLYRLDVDNNGGCRLGAPSGTPLVWETLGRSQLHMPFTGTYNPWFYVPKGTAHVEGWFDGGHIKVYDNTAKLITSFNASSGYYAWDVPPGKDGTCMRLVGVSQRMGFTTIPPWIAIDPAGLCVPSEVAAADGL